ncbi:erythromycin esterase family protein [Pedobacter agri]|uniref:erythromycin esterase family protein n=1 Tax=Pedobacter agri TaxID=454586 RepID=UPI00278229B5|nr:erythromycin esterase family protein [Pedobacter agri]MDQ1142786.1 erythromycin esterase [Pedobacter agri]
MPKKILLTLCVLIVISGCVKKEVSNYVTENLVEIKTISPDSTEFSDLEALGEAIGDSRVVMLGEQDHGDGSTFLAKTRIIKYLHERKNFDVLAFESDFFALNEGWSKLEKQESKINAFVSENIFSIWSKSKECENLLYHYIPKTYTGKKPLEITGFDNQVHAKYSLSELKFFIDKFLKREKIKYVGTKKYRDDFIAFFDEIKYNEDIRKQQKFNESLRQIITELAITDIASFEMMLIKSLKSTTESEIALLTKRNDPLEIRDKQMAENLKWLLKYKFQGTKVIVWAHNIHILKHPELIKGDFIIKRNMGSYLTADRDLNSQIYVVGFNSRTTTYGRITGNKIFAVEEPSKSGFESWIPENIPYAFVDFQRYRARNPSEKKYFPMKGAYHITNFAPWIEIYDGIFYIRDMYPSSLRSEK